MNKTILRETRKALSPIFNNQFNSSESIFNHMNNVYEIIMNDVHSEEAFLKSKTNFRLFFVEMLTSFTNHQFNSVALLFRSFTVSFCVEYFKMSKTQQKDKISTFAKAIKFVDEIFENEEHGKAGYEQLLNDFDYEISKLDPIINSAEFIHLSSQKNFILNTFDYEKYKEKNINDFRNTISICNKIAHSELEMNSNNDTSAIILRDNAIMCINLAISMLILIIRKYNN